MTDGMADCPNPWCGRGVLGIDEREGGFVRVSCTCGVAGPASTDEAAAIRLWNERPTNTPMSGGDVATGNPCTEHTCPLCSRSFESEHTPNFCPYGCGAISPNAGYAEAFYELAEMMGLPAMPDSPAVVWERDMKPRLSDALNARLSGGDVERLLDELRAAARHITSKADSFGWDTADHEAVERLDVAALNLATQFATLTTSNAAGGDEVERVIRDLAKKLYAHHVIKYDPEAEERCIKEAIAALHAGGEQPLDGPDQQA